MNADLHAAVCVACIVTSARRSGPAGPLPSAPGCPLDGAAALAGSAA